MNLDGAVCILTGASRGIGTYLADALARKGARLALAARSTDDLEETAGKLRALGTEVVAVPTDVTNRGDLETLVRRTSDELGPPDVLVNNAGIQRIAAFETFDLETIERIVATNLIAPQLLTRLLLPGMIERGRGHIVNIASVAGKTGPPYYQVYASTKHGLVGFSWSLRAEVARHGIGVSVVCPGFVSDVGMYAQRTGGRASPRSAASVSPRRVAERTVRAIERNKAETIVARGLPRFGDIFYAISPELSIRMTRRAGLEEFLASTTHE